MSLAQDRALAILVFANGEVENRVFRPPTGQTPSQMREAVNFLNAVGQGKTLQELQGSISAEISHHRTEIDTLTAALVETGVAVLQDAGGSDERLIVRGRSNLLENDGTAEDSSLVVSPYMNADRKVIGAVGVIGPTRLNYGRIVPIVNYTAQMVGRVLSDRS